MFMDKFVGTVVGKNRWIVKIRGATGKREVCSATDEALALVLLENNQEKWYDIYTRTKDDTTILTRKKKGSEWASTVATLYTERGQRDGERSVRQGDRGWSKGGIQRFNEIVQFLKDDRESHPLFVRSWLKSKRVTDDSGKKPRAKKQHNILTATNELDEAGDFDDASSHGGGPSASDEACGVEEV